MKLYISYYGNYVTIVEGVYNHKKQKYNIKNLNIITSQDVKTDSNDKYSLLKEALRTIDTKVKNVVFLLNTRDVIVKSTQMSKMEPKDLDGVMNNEMYEMMSLHDEQYTFSYEVTNETTVDDKEVLDIVMAAISNKELEIITSIFKSFNLYLERIDTISTAYSRILENIEYRDIMMLNIGDYGSIVNIYKEDSLFIHDNIPVRINEFSNYQVSLALVDEVKGLTNFYSSRNYGKSLDTIVLVGESNKNKYVKQAFEESFNSSLLIGIENLFDIENDLTGDIQKDEISRVCDILGSMLIPKYTSKDYAYMNLLPISLRNRKNIQDKLKQALMAVPVVAILVTSPSFCFNLLANKINQNTVIAQSRLDEIVLEYKNIEDINEQITKSEEELEIYNMINSKSTNWGNILSSIDKSIPYKVDLISIDTYYNSELANSDTESSNEEENTEEEKSIDEPIEEKVETPMYDQVPNIITIDGVSKTSERVGQFVYSLNKVDYFKSVKLINSSEDKENEGYKFNIVLELAEGAVSGD